MIQFGNSGLYTDLYELTMVQGYFLHGRHEQEATFDYFYRKNPFHGGYVVFSGLAELLQKMENFCFGPRELQYLKKQGFRDEFLDYLENLRFSGEIVSCLEGEIVFPLEPVLRITGNVVETQLVESLLLNFLNYSSLVSTKMSRIRKEAGDCLISDFGLRRAQGLGSMLGARAAMIGGANSTSNVMAGAEYGIPVSGTMAHSWVQSFETEIEAFRAYADVYPENCILLIDTYDTLGSGLENAMTVGNELEKKGYRLKGVRLDSGDLAYLSKKARKRLDENGFSYVDIVASNQLDEYLIRSLGLQQASLDVFGVGTSLITGASDAALDGVYKMSDNNGSPRLKISEDPTKLSFPGKKNVIRFYDWENYFYADAVILDEENNVDKMIHPYHKEKKCDFKGMDSERLLHQVMKNGKITADNLDIQEIAAYTRNRLNYLDGAIMRLENPHIYKVGLSPELVSLRDSIAFKKQKNGG